MELSWDHAIAVIGVLLGAWQVYLSRREAFKKTDVSPWRAFIKKAMRLSVLNTGEKKTSSATSGSNTFKKSLLHQVTLDSRQVLLALTRVQKKSCLISAANKKDLTYPHTVRNADAQYKKSREVNVLFTSKKSPTRQQLWTAVPFKKGFLLSNC